MLVDLLNLGEYQGIKLVDVARFLKILEKKNHTETVGSSRNKQRSSQNGDSLSFAKIGRGPWEDLSSPSYERALGYEVTRDAWRKMSSRSPSPLYSACRT